MIVLQRASEVERKNLRGLDMKKLQDGFGGI